MNAMEKDEPSSRSVACGLPEANRIVPSAESAAVDHSIVFPDDAIFRLKEGNRRYTSGNLQHPHQSSENRAELVESQHPFAVIVGCADSRVPPEILFDQGLGDLFVLRVAGNVVGDLGLGSVEYAVEHLAVRLVVVLGHQGCGAVKAAKATITARGKAPGHIQSLVIAIRPAVEATTSDDLEMTVKRNVKDVVQTLRSSTPVLNSKVDAGELCVIGAYYSLDTSAVTFLDEK